MDAKMEEKENMPGFVDLPNMEMNSSPPSQSDPDDDDNEADDSNVSDGDEGKGGVGIGTSGVVGGPPLKKGPWTPEEDNLLRTYVEARGEGNWNQVQRNAGLNRCGKSCRLRWANHLRPELKKGPFDKEEERKIIELHATMGNKWAKMATYLPGRTDNEIKNYWNTRCKRRIKAGLGIYPADVLSRVANQDMDCRSPDDSHSKKRPNELLQGNGIEVGEIVFDKLDYKKQSENIFAGLLIPNPPPSDVMNPLKRHASSGNIASEYNVGLTCDQFPDGPEKTFYSTDVSYEISKDPSSPFGSAIASGPAILDGNFSTSGTIQRPVIHFGSAIASGPAILDGNFSTSGTIQRPSIPFGSAIASGPAILDGNLSTSGTIQRPSKMELPSFQYSSRIDYFNLLYGCPSASPIAQDDPYTCPPECNIQQNTGLLDSLLQEEHGLGDCTKSQGPTEVLVPPVQHAHASSLSPPGVDGSSASSADTFAHPDLIYLNKNNSSWNNTPFEANYQPDSGFFSEILLRDPDEACKMSDVDLQTDLDQSTWNTISELLTSNNNGACRVSPRRTKQPSLQQT